MAQRREPDVRALFEAALGLFLVLDPDHRAQSATAAAWLFGIARHKLADDARRGSAERTDQELPNRRSEVRILSGAC